MLEFQKVCTIYLPENRVKVGSVELVGHGGRCQFGAEQRDKLLKVYLAVAWPTNATKLLPNVFIPRTNGTKNRNKKF